MQIQVEPNIEVSATLRQLKSENAIYSGLEEAISEFKSAIATIPDRVNTIVLRLVSLNALGRDKEAAISQLFHQAKHLTEIYSHVLACNYAALTHRILRSLNY